MPSESTPLPKLSQLPLNEGDPHYSAWGLYGKADELGTLNRLTDEVVLRAARDEIQSGVRYETCFTDSCLAEESFIPVDKIPFICPSEVREGRMGL